MKLIKILIIVLFFTTNVLADTIYYLLKIPNLEIIDIKNNNSIKTSKAKKYFPKFQSILMQVAKSGVVNKKTASRKISKVSKKIK